MYEGACRMDSYCDRLNIDLRTNDKGFSAFSATLEMEESERQKVKELEEGQTVSVKCLKMEGTRIGPYGTHCTLTN